MPKKIAIILVLILSLTLGGCQSPGGLSPSPTEDTSVPAGLTSNLTLWMLDVGQGDCLLIKSPRGKYLLVDGGPGDNALMTLGELQALGVDKIDLLVVSHGHEDHVGALAAILKQIPVRQAYLPPEAAATRAYEQMLLALKARHALVGVPSAGTALLWDNSVKIEVVGPLKSNYTELNDSSLVLRLEWGRTSFLLTGDITAAAEDDLLEQGNVLPITVLKVAHHGSNASTSAHWLNQLQPAVALISAGAGNDYGHPGAATLQRLQASNVKVLRTDQTGTIRLVSDGTRVQVYGGQASAEDRSPAAIPLIGNLNSRVYHQPDADHLPRPGNQISFTSRTEAANAGYRACSRCFPPGNREE